MIRSAAVLIMLAGCDRAFDLAKVGDPVAVDAALVDAAPDAAACEVPRGAELVAHFRADQLAAGPVTSWPSLVGTLTLVDEGSGPQAVPAVLNGHAAVRFDGTNDHLTITAFGIDVAATFGTADPALTVLFVSDTHATSFQQQGLWLLGDRAMNESTITLRYCDCGLGNGVHFNVTTQDPSPQAASIHDVAALLSDPVVWTAVRTSSREQLLYRNGTQISTVAVGPAVSMTTTNERTLTIGMINDSDYFTGDIAEIVIYKTGLDAGSRAQAERCLGERYGITIP